MISPLTAAEIEAVRAMHRKRLAAKRAHKHARLDYLATLAEMRRMKETLGLSTDAWGKYARGVNGRKPRQE